MTHPVVLKAERAAAWRQHCRRLCNPVESRNLSAFDSGLIIQAVGEYFGVSASDITGSAQTASITQARQFCAFLMRSEARRSWHFIGRALNRHHTTAIAAWRKVEKLRLSEPEVEADISAIKSGLLDGW